MTASRGTEAWQLSPWDQLQYRLLRRFWPFAESKDTPRPPAGKARIQLVFGDEFVKRVAGKTVIDFGCGKGHESVELAEAGAKQVIGLDVLDGYLREARNNASQAGVAQVCQFAQTTDTQADLVISIDAFEHFADPAGILRQMGRLCKPDGEIWIHFGPTWYHPLGGHLFAVFPWAHLLFSETALCRWRADFISDGARRFSEVAGGLNRMTLKRFERIAQDSGLRIVRAEGIPIRVTRPFYCRPLREFLTAAGRYRLSH
jgi:SAM-dependent methyltransferase